MAEQNQIRPMWPSRGVHGPVGMACALVATLAAGCIPDEGTTKGAVPDGEPAADTSPLLDTAPDTATEEGVKNAPTSTVDLAAVAGIDPIPSGERTRSMVAADFDNDGRDDLFVGNPGDKSYILRNTSTPGAPSFKTAQVLSDGHISWTAAAADFDNDGDVDLYVGGGGNECAGVDQLWENQLVETGELSFVDVRLEMGLTLTDYGQDASWDLIPTTGVRWVDVDMDGWLDLYVTHNNAPRCFLAGQKVVAEINELWHNLGGTRFERITVPSGLGGIQASTRHPSILDYDNDGDPDIFDSNLHGENILFHNMFVETGEIVFGQVDTSADDDSLAYPQRAFASCAADLNNDGWEDLVVLSRSATECVIPEADSAADSSAYIDGNYHGVYVNHGSGGFDNRTEAYGLAVNEPTGRLGVMGCQVGDLNGDGLEDVFVGNGGPQGAAENDLYLSRVTGNAFVDASQAVRDQTGEGDAMRTHATVIMDVDGDHKPELVVGNGGPYWKPDVREPNQIFQFRWDHAAEFLQVRLVGDGVHVNRDAIGSRLELVFELPDGSTRSVHRSMRGGNCFSADNGRRIGFGLGRGASGAEAGAPSHLKVTWPNGVVTDHPVSIAPGTSDELTLRYAP